MDPYCDSRGLGLFQDTSWLELFWGYIHDTSVLPAFLYYHDWVGVPDDPSLEFATPSLVTMFRTWNRTFDAILRSSVAVPWSQRLTKVKSVRAFGPWCFDGLLRPVFLFPASFFVAGACIYPAFNYLSDGVHALTKYSSVGACTDLTRLCDL